jgi:hypothetical protein
MSSLKVAAITDTSGGNTATINSMTPTADSLQGFRNRIINGDMGIDQRNAGASVTPTSGQYTLDRWVFQLTQASKFTAQQNAGSVTPPVGFSNYLGITSSSAYSVLTGDTFLVDQRIEGFNTADLAWGTASAATVTLSFWVRSSLTGTFGGALTNSASNRSYPFSYTISSANTWEKETITIAGDTSGTWVGSTNGIGLIVRFGLGSGSTFTSTAGAWAAGNFVQSTGSTSVVGTNGATFYITGVQLEVGSVATPFERIDYGRELMLCQRYYYKTAVAASAVISTSAFADTTTSFGTFGSFPVRLRTAPSALEQSGTASDYRWNGTSSIACSAVPAFSSRTSTDMWQVNCTVTTGLTAGHGGSAVTNSGNGYLAWSAEL